jgi:uncharacterized protein YkvS
MELLVVVELLTTLKGMVTQINRNKYIHYITIMTINVKKLNKIFIY